MMCKYKVVLNQSTNLNGGIGHEKIGIQEEG